MPLHVPLQRRSVTCIVYVQAGVCNFTPAASAGRLAAARLRPGSPQGPDTVRSDDHCSALAGGPAAVGARGVAAAARGGAVLSAL